MAIKNTNGYHRLSFAYAGNESIARIVVETWKDEGSRLANKGISKTYEFDKTLLNYEKTADYVMYNYNKSKENCDDRFVTACYEYIKTLEGYEDCEDIDIDNRLIVEEVVENKLLTKHQFLERFTDEETAKLFNSSLFIDMMPITAQEKTNKKITMGVIIGKLTLAEKIDLGDTALVQKYFDSFKSVGLITEIRLKQILGL
jgi:hypothetical protein